MTKGPRKDSLLTDTGWAILRTGPDLGAAKKRRYHGTAARRASEKHARRFRQERLRAKRRAASAITDLDRLVLTLGTEWTASVFLERDENGRTALETLLCDVVHAIGMAPLPERGDKVGMLVVQRLACALQRGTVLPGVRLGDYGPPRVYLDVRLEPVFSSAVAGLNPAIGAGHQGRGRVVKAG